MCMAFLTFADRLATMRPRLYRSVQRQASLTVSLPLCVCLLIYGPTTPILAQAPVSGPDTPAQPEPEGSPERPAESPSIANAREHIGRGQTAFELGNYPAALSEMQTAYALLEGHPLRYLTLYNIASCYQRMVRYELAIEYYERYLAEAPADDGDRDEIRGRLLALKDLLATLDVQANVPDAELWIDGHAAGKVPEHVLVTAGVHRVEVRAPGRMEARADVELKAGEARQLHMSLTALPSERGLHPAYFWTGVGLTGAALVTGTAFGLRAVRLHNQTEDQISSDDPSERYSSVVHDPRPTIRRNANAADIAFAATAVLGVGTLVLYAFTDFKKEKKSTNIQPVLASSFLGARIQGEF
jgi:hypothetical protein